MAIGQEVLRDWHRLFGLLLTDFFTGSPFSVEIECDLSVQQQLLDVVILRRGRGRFDGILPDGLDGLAAYNLITFKSHREALDGWAVKELVGHYVAYRKLVSSSPSEMLPEEWFRLYAVCARFPHNLSSQVPWRKDQLGVYDCSWGTDVVRVVVAGELPRTARNAPLHLFSASPNLVDFGRAAYRRRSESTSRLLQQLFLRLEREGFAMPYTMEDFERDYFIEHFPQLPQEKRDKLWRALPPEDQEKWLQALPPEDQEKWLQALPPKDLEKRLQALPLERRLAGLSAEQIRQYLKKLTGSRPEQPRKPRRKRS